MNKFSYVWFPLCIVYSIILIYFEVGISQDFARFFFTDIKGEVPFYAVNTTFSVSLLLGTALMFAVCLVCLGEQSQPNKERNFYFSQVIIFGYLALDDRFLIHEKLGYLLNISDAIILFLIGILELYFIFAWSNWYHWTKTTKINLFKASICFFLMLVIDGFFPKNMIPRLSLEDLAKTWSNIFLFLFAWNIYLEKINLLKSKANHYFK